jgi:hypothetical protein
MISMTVNGRLRTYDFGLEEGVIEVVEVHVDVIGGDEDGEHAEEQRYVVFVANGGLDTVRFTVGETVRRQVFRRRALHHDTLFQYLLLIKPTRKLLI